MRMQPGDEEPTAEDHRNYGSLLKLNEAFGLAKMRGLFFDIERVDAKGAGRSQEEVVARIRERFPERAARAAITAPLPDLTRYVVMEFEEGVDLEEALRRYREDPLVESVQRDRYLEVDDVPNDPFFHSKGSWGQPEDDLWGLKRINIERAWGAFQGGGDRGGGGRFGGRLRPPGPRGEPLDEPPARSPTTGSTTTATASSMTSAAGTSATATTTRPTTRGSATGRMSRGSSPRSATTGSAWWASPPRRR